MDQWNHTAFIAAAVHNSQCADKASMVSPMELHPMHARKHSRVRGVRLDPETIRIIAKGMSNG